MKNSDLKVEFEKFRSQFNVITSCPENERWRVLPNVKSLMVDIRNHLEAILDSDLIGKNPDDVITYAGLIRGYQILLAQLKTIERLLTVKEGRV